jgi:type II secretory pathway pseudopilin PulG
MVLVMKLRRKMGFSGPPPARAQPKAFTLVEVMAALVFMAIVIPVAIEGLRIASRAGVVSQRKSVAARIAERLLNEAVLANQWSQSVQSEVGNQPVQNGTEKVGPIAFRWTFRNLPWDQNALNQNGLTPSTPMQMNQGGSTPSGTSQAGTSPVSIPDLTVLRQLSVEVLYPAQNQFYSVRLSTVIINSSN